MAALAAAVIVAAAEIGVVSAIFPVLRGAFALSTAHLGTFTAIYLLARMCFGPAWGVLADRYGRKRVLVVAVLGWSLGIAGTGLVRSYPQLLILYSFGVTGAVAVEPIVHAIISDLFPAHERGKAFGAVRALLGLGVGICTPLIGWLAGFPDGWRLGYYVLGALQLGSGLLLIFGLKEPGAGASEDPPAPDRARAKFNLRDVPKLLAIPSVRLLAVNYVLATSITALLYLPTFLTEVRGFSVQASTRMFGLMQFGVVLGSFLGGLLGDWAERRHPRAGRIMLMQVYLAAFAAMTGLIFQLAWHAPAAGYALLFVFGVIFPIGFSGCVLPMLATVISPEMRSTGFGLLSSFFQGLSLAVLSLTVGILADRHGLSAMLFWAVTIPYMMNAIVWFWFYRIYPSDVANLQRQLDVRREGRSGGGVAV